MGDAAGKERRKTSNRALDIFVVIFCLCGAIASLYYFYLDIYATFRSLNIVPAGTVTVKYNTVQRRLADRAVWDRLFEQSAVYSGDLVRIARLSGATLNIDENSIELGENTLIRIQKDEGPLQIEFSYGNISVTSARDRGTILLSIGDQVVQVQPGAEISALSGDGGLVLRVTEGAAQVIKEGQITEVPAGGIIVRDTEGNEVRQPMAAVVHPKPNAVLLKTEAGPLIVEFKWARINLQPQELLRLEIAEDKYFKRIVQTVDNLDSSAIASLNTGLWHWRLLNGN
ncbi:FecR family protein, partial [Treponema sp. R8-4-B8]